MPEWDTIPGALFWLIFWPIGLIALALYIPIGVAWIIGYGVYLGAGWVAGKLATSIISSKEQS